MNVNLNLLQTFLLVAERESFRQAAEESHRTPSAVSMQIKHLEDQVGAPLFVRTTRKVELTADGQQLLVRVREALTDVGSGLQELRDAVELRRGRVSLASSFSIASTRLPDVLARFKLQHPATIEAQGPEIKTETTPGWLIVNYEFRQRRQRLQNSCRPQYICREF